MDDKIKKLVEYIADRAESESAFLQPCPQHYIFAEPLLDIISEIFGIDKAEITECVNAIADQKERQIGA